MEEVLLVETRGAVRLLTLNRPKKLNALNADLIKALTEALLAVQHDDSAAVVVLSGAGRAFCPGMDTSAPRLLTTESRKHLVRHADDSIDLFKLLARIDKPVIAAVNGFALGGGCELALACDFIYATPNAKFGLPECTLGIMPGFGGTVRLSRRVGIGIARIAAYTGQMYTAQEALQMGLVNKVVENGQLIESAMDIARAIASRAPHAIAAIKKSINDGQHMSMSDAQELEAKLFANLFHTQDQKEGTRAFIEKRKPAFQGK